MTPDAFADVLKAFGFPTAVLIFALWTGARGIWVFGWVFKMVEEDRDAWRRQAESGTDLARTAVTQGDARRRPS